MQCICVMGMHRSGTSSLTGIMQRFGVELGEVFTENPYNKRGNRENADIMNLNNEVLAYNGGAWNKPVAVTAWTEAQVQQRDEIINKIMGAATFFWGFKDPRSLCTLPFWLNAGLNPLFIGTFRHPLRVASSLQARNNMTIDEGLGLWMAYNKNLIDLWTQHPFPLVNFDLPPEQYVQSVIDKLITILGSEFLQKQDYAKDFFCKDLRNQSLVDISGTLLPPKVVAMYERLLAYSW